MPLLDTLQSGYPTVQPGQGTSLLDLLQGLLTSGGSTAQPSAADTKYAAAQSDADSQLKSGLSSLLGAFTPPAQAAQSNAPYAMGTPDPTAQGIQFSNGTGSPMGFGGGTSQPSAQALPPILPTSPAASLPIGSASFTPPAGAPPLAAAASSSQDLGAPVVVADGDTSGTAGTSAQPTGGLLGSLGAQVSDAAQSPQASKGLLSSFADKARAVGDKLSNLSPAASQALLASGLTILSGNDGTRNLGQLVGMGGISGLNTYNSARQQQVENTVAQQKLAQTAQQQAFTNKIDTGKLAVEQYNATHAPITVAPGSSLFQKDGTPIAAGTPQVARTIDVQMPDGSTVTRQYGQSGQQIGPDIPKNNPYVGPLDTSAQATVNAAQTAAAQATQTYQRTAQLANALNSADFSGGVPAAINDTLTKFTGSKDAGQQLRGQLAQFANSSILSELPPGSASDKDIQLVRNGVPSDTAGKDTWQAYLSAVGNIQRASAVLQSAKADYASANRGNLGPLMQPAVINGIQYPKGTSFTQVASGVQPQQQQAASNTGTYSLSAIDAAIARKKGR